MYFGNTSKLIRVKKFPFPLGLSFVFSTANIKDGISTEPLSSYICNLEAPP